MMGAGLGVGMDGDRAGQSFCAPTRGKLIAAARSMPGVWGVVVEPVAGDHPGRLPSSSRPCRLPRIVPGLSRAVRPGGVIDPTGHPWPL